MENLNNVSCSFSDLCTVGDLKKFIEENNIRDDATVKVSYESCCESEARSLYYDKDTNELIVME